MQLSIIAVRGVIAAVSRLGFPTRRLLQDAGIDESSLSDTRTRVSVASFEILIRNALELTGRPGLGLSVGEAAPEFLLMIHFAQALPTLRDAVHMLRRYSGVVMSDVSVMLGEGAGRANFSFAFPAGCSPDTECFFAELFAALCFRTGAQIFTSGRAPLEVHFCHPAPAHALEYQRVFGCPITFDAQQNAILFEASLLDLKQPHPDAFMAEVLREACDALLASTEPVGTLKGRVLAVLRRQVELHRIDTEALAEELGSNLRALRRNLAREGVTMTQLVEQARVAAAAAELLRPGSTLKEASSKMGYSDVSAFNRAFKRWMGKTPGAYVREHMRPPD